MFPFLLNRGHGAMYTLYDIGHIICVYTTRTLFHFFMQYCAWELYMFSHCIKRRTFISNLPATSCFELWESPCWSSYRKRRTMAICAARICCAYSPLEKLYSFSVLTHIDPYTIKAIPLSDWHLPSKTYKTDSATNTTLQTCCSTSLAVYIYIYRVFHDFRA